MRKFVIIEVFLNKKNSFQNFEFIGGDVDYNSLKRKNLLFSWLLQHFYKQVYLINDKSVCKDYENLKFALEISFCLKCARKKF